MIWWPDVGIGYLPTEAPEAVYDEAYFNAYVERADSHIGRELTAARVDMVRRWHPGAPVLDVGIGSGQFVQAFGPEATGYDINPAAVKWLKERNRFDDLYRGGPYPALCFWDALEHIPDPAAAVAQASQWVFVSLPVFEDRRHCLRSKHFKPGEHIWYFEDRGIRAWFHEQGFECVHSSDIESRIGREGIISYVFRRRPNR